MAGNVVSALPASLNIAPRLADEIVGDEILQEHAAALAQRVVFTVTPRTISGRRLQDDRGLIVKYGHEAYIPLPKAVDHALKVLTKAGFEIIRVGRFAITAAGPASRINDFLDIRLAMRRRLRPSRHSSLVHLAMTDTSPGPSDLFVAPQETLSLPSKDQTSPIDHIVFVPPPLLYEISPAPPLPNYPHLMTDDIRRLLNVPSDAKGKGVTVAIVDSGLMEHPHYPAGKVRFRQVPNGPALGVDPIGHGTAMPFNILATAPESQPVVLGYPKAALQDALEIAVLDEKAPIVSCSWGFDHEQTFPVIELSIRSLAQDDGAIFLFAAGNGQISWPASMPEVIAVGGVFANPSGGALEASNFASGFASSHYPGRVVPDVSGLCGQNPRGIYIPMPVPPGSEMNSTFAGGAYPNGDETPAGSGWAVFSGTSAATPQIAGVVALMLERASQKGRSLKPDDVRTILQNTAVPVTSGRNALGISAETGSPNLACGYGLVDAAAAIAAV